MIYFCQWNVSKSARQEFYRPALGLPSSPFLVSVITEKILRWSWGLWVTGANRVPLLKCSGCRFSVAKNRIVSSHWDFSAACYCNITWPILTDTIAQCDFFSSGSTSLTTVNIFIWLYSSINPPYLYMSTSIFIIFLPNNETFLFHGLFYFDEWHQHSSKTLTQSIATCCSSFNYNPALLFP